MANTRDKPEEAKIQEIKQKIKKAINRNETLLSFLKENKIYGRFIKNTVNYLIQDTKVNYICNVNYVAEKIKLDYNPIGNIFIWSKTSEGHDFWKKHNLTYIATIKNKEKY